MNYINPNKDECFIDDFIWFCENRLNEFIEGKERRQYPYSGTARGYRLFPKLKKIFVKNVLMNLDGILLDGSLSFPNNYKNNVKIFRKYINENYEEIIEG